MPKAGDHAPKFRLPSTSGSYVGLDDFLGKKNLVVFFYPKDNSAGCTKEACAFRDSYQAFNELDAEVIGISPDSKDSHETFAKGNQLQFTLLSDPDGSVRKAYGVKPTLGLIPGRATFVINKQGIIVYIYSSQIHLEAHMKEALQALRSLAQRPASTI